MSFCKAEYKIRSPWKKFPTSFVAYCKNEVKASHSVDKKGKAVGGGGIHKYVHLKKLLTYAERNCRTSDTLRTLIVGSCLRSQ